MKEKLRALISPAAPGRRRFVCLGAAALVLPFASKLRAAGPRPAAPLPPDRGLAFFNIHSGESLSAAYCRDGVLVPESLIKIDRVLRDTRTGEVHEIDIALLDLLVLLARDLPAREPFHVISGYRSRTTNEYLRLHGGGGVVANSLHLVGKAVDIRVPGVALKTLYRAAVSLRGGGVGLYPSSDFIHVDVGRVRTW